MFVNSVSLDVIGAAYIIAANYLEHTGRIPVEVESFQPLFASIVDDYCAGDKNTLRLANRAISRFESFSHEIA